MGVGVLIDGKWTDDDESYRKDGAFIRATTAFRAFVTADVDVAFPAEAGRYHLYVARPCPWCHRTMIFRALKKLEDVVSMSMVEPLLLLDKGWKFAVPDPVTGARFVHELYTKADPHYTGRVSVPVLWDKKTGTIVSNESSESIRMFNGAFAAFTDERTDYYPAFAAFTDERTDYYPAALRSEIDAVNARVYETLNNGVYRWGGAAAGVLQPRRTAIYPHQHPLYRQPPMHTLRPSQRFFLAIVGLSAVPCPAETSLSEWLVVAAGRA